MKSTLLASIILLAATVAEAQTWTSIASFNQKIEDLKSYNGKLFIGGGFTQRDGSTSYWSSIYNGTSFTNQPTLIGGVGIRNFDIYQGELWATGGMQIGSSAGVSWWDTTAMAWRSGGNFNKSHSGIYADVLDLYVGSDFGVVSKSANGGSFTALPAFDGSNGSIRAITKFNGQIVVAGTFSSYLGTTLNRIAKWNGTTWLPLGTGLDFSVQSLIVYKNELYAAGLFGNAGGTAARNIAKWNGTSWTNVGGSVTSPGGNGIRDMVVYNNKLYVAGDFTEIGGITAKYVAVWDGITWKALSLTPATVFPNSIEVYKNRLYVGTYHSTVSNLYVADITTGINDEERSHVDLQIYPNPVVNLLTISYGGNLSPYSLEATVYDVSGKVVFKQSVRDYSLDLSGLKAGIYLIELNDKHTRYLIRKKVIKI